MTEAIAMEDLGWALRDAGIEEFDMSSLARAEYSADASLYRVPPAAIVRPRDLDEVAAVVKVAEETKTPITPRGAGTSIAGNAVGKGIILDFTKHFARVLDIDPRAGTATVQPGVVLDSLQAAAAPHGLRFGPDPSTHNRCTIGGMLGNNACGSRALGYGRTADNVVSIELLSGTGRSITAMRGMDPAGSPTLAALSDLVRENLATLRTQFGRFRRQVSGYSLEHLLPENGFNLAKALVGTEGTLGIVTEATLNLVERPTDSVLVVLGYPDMPAAADAVPALLPHNPVAMEGLDARIVDVVQERKGAGRVPKLPKGKGWLMVELAGRRMEELSALAARMVREAGALDSMIVTDPREAAALWRIREDGSGLSARSMENRPAHAGWEDSAVPPEQLGDYLREFEELLKEFDLTSMPYGHFGDGCVHARIDFPLDRTGGPARFREYLFEAAKLVARHGGSMSGEHGDGRARGELLPMMYSPDVIGLFGAVKGIFDPLDLMNPGVIVRPRPVHADIRVAEAKPVTRKLGLRFAHDHGDFSEAVHRCTGVGKCRADTTASGGVMCPSYLATGEEKDSTRGRARILQEMVNGSIVGNGWRSPEVRDALDLCLSCKGCASDCPTGVDMAAYKAEALHQAYRHRPRPATHYSLGWLPRWARLASKTPKLANGALGNRGLAAIAKFFGGIDKRRDLPQFTEQTFRAWYAENRTGNSRVDGQSPVLLWVDTFTNYFQPEVAVTALRFLESLGFAVHIPEKPVCCGLTWISTGQLSTARRMIRRSMRELDPFVRLGVPIVGLEPSCTAVFRSDAAELLRGTKKMPLERVEEIAGSTYTLAELLRKFRPQWTPPDLSGTEVVAQPHCHQHAVLGWQADEELLKRSGAQVRSVGGCCGLAGNFGVERGHYDVSVKVAENALLPAVREAGEAVVLADGFSCRTQLDQLADRRALHMVELLTREAD
nr:FAD-binding and (Fe-S)-binding domain-containing protein [Sciscionella sp. SE31]